MVKEDVSLLRFRSVSFSYNDESPFLRGLDFEVLSGEFAAVLGPTGSGKSTVLKMCVGIFLPLKGEVLFQTKPVVLWKQDLPRLFAQKVSMSFQRLGLFDSLTVLDNLMFPLEHLTALSFTKKKSLSLEVLKRVGLQGSEQKHPQQLSGGMQKRLTIARAIVLKPELLILDDPTAGLDPLTSLELMEFVKELHKKEGTTILMATSDVDMAMRVSQKLLLLHESEVLPVGSPHNIKSKYQELFDQFREGHYGS